MNASTISEMEEYDNKWKCVTIDNTKYSICSTETIDGSWNIILTNLIYVWTEKLDRGKILEKCEKLNPTLSIKDIDVYKIVRQILKDIPKYAGKVSVDRIELSCELEGGIFEFGIDTTRGSAEELWNEVTMPLCLAAGELRRRETILTSFIKKKDTEITEYKLNGAELIRKHIMTEPFNEELLKKNVPIQNAECCQNTFQLIMELKQDMKVEKCSVKSEITKMCFTEPVSKRKNTANIAVEEDLEEKNQNLVIDKQGLSNIEGNLMSKTAIEESNEILSKIDKKILPESPKTMPKSNKSQIDIPKRTQKSQALSVKRPKKSIHDYIK